MSENLLLSSLGVSCETKSRLSVYVDFLLKWNKKVNLISKNTVPDVWIRHIVDSAQLMKFIADTNQSLVDIGTGCGLPGIVLSILGINHVILVESDIKKASFLREAVRMLELNVQIINDRVENTYINGDILVSRGFSTLSTIFTITTNIKSPRMLLLKGENVEAEIESSNKIWKFDCKKHKSITNEQSYILDITNVQKRS